MELLTYEQAGQRIKCNANGVRKLVADKKLKAVVRRIHGSRKFIMDTEVERYLLSLMGFGRIKPKVNHPWKRRPATKRELVTNYY